jgi:RNA polymerase sigma-70 factor (ECF subfamily)
VLSALRLLEPKARTAFIFRHYYGYTYPELAHELGVSENTAKSRVAAAVSRLSRLLEGGRG